MTTSDYNVKAARIWSLANFDLDVRNETFPTNVRFVLATHSLVLARHSLVLAAAIID
jgi:hypothetical protein